MSAEGDMVKKAGIIALLLLVCSIATGQSFQGVSIDRQYRAQVTWGASTSPGVTYNVYRNGVKINPAAVTGLSYVDANVQRRTSYTWTVRSYDPVSQLESVDSTPVVKLVP